MATKGYLRVIIENFLLSNIPSAVGINLARAIAEDFERETASDYREFMEYLISIPEYPAPIKRALQFTISGRNQAGAAVLISGVIGAAVAIVIGIVSPFFQIGKYATEHIAQTFRFPFDLGVAYAARNPSQRGAIKRHFQDQGVAPEVLEGLMELYEPRVTEYDLARLYYRDPIRRNVVMAELRNRGYSNEEIGRILELVKAYPSASDLITWAVRDAFNPNTVQRFSLNEDFPPDFREEAEKLGMDDRFISAAWAAHWRLPSLTEAFNMYHRLRPALGGETFTDDDLDLLMKTADIAPYFRPKLKEIATDVFTRVDIRRMRQIGVLDRVGVFNAYRDLGYNADRAHKLTEFVELDIQTETRDLSKEMLMAAYRIRELTASELRERLIEIGYLAEDIEVLIRVEDVRQEQANLKLALERVELLYVQGEITETEVYNQLGQYVLSADFLEHTLREWNLRKQAKIALPSVGDLEKLYERNIISGDQLKTGLHNRGYQTDTIEWLVRLLEEEIAERAAIKLERTRKEQNRLLAATNTRQFQLDRADLDVQIAEIELEIAEVKRGASGITDPQAKSELAARLAELSVAKEEVQLDVANLVRDYRESNLGSGG